ncbi:MAG: SIS domain-containing protein [Patescibacteria group bacterium]
MSGLFGYLGQRPCLPILVQGLKLMQGYSFDSGGVLLKGPEKFFVRKVLGSHDELEKSVLDYNGNEVLGGVHLRWATHGEVAEKNIHPVFSCDGKVAVMHKGLISNYKQLKELLLAEGHVFKTDTDTEVIAHLIEKYYLGDLTVAVRRALLEVDGTYALLVFYMDELVEMVMANAGMGTMIGLGDSEYWVSMSKRVIYPFTDRVVYLNDGEMAHITPKGFVTSVIAGGSINVVNKYIETLKESTSGIDEYFNRIEMEIANQPEMVRNIIAGRLDFKQASTHFGGLSSYVDLFREVKRLNFIGSGSSYYAALMAKVMIENTLPITVAAYSGMDFVNKKHYFNEMKSALFIISQSGRTPDTLAAMREAKQLGLPVFGITNTVGGAVARNTDAGIFLHSGPTLGMPSTKSFVSQLIAIVMLTIYLGRLLGTTPGFALDVLHALDNLPNNLSAVINNSHVYRNLVKRYINYSDYVVVGSKFGYPIAKEVALLLCEIANIKAESLDYSEIKYGLINRVNQNSLFLFMLSPDKYFFDEGIKLAMEIKKRGGKVVGITSQTAQFSAGVFSDLIQVPDTHAMILPILFLTTLQMWAFYLGKERNLIPDQTDDQVLPEAGYYW